MGRRWRWAIVALVMVAVVLQGSGGRVDAGTLQAELAPVNPEYLRYVDSTRSEGSSGGLGLVPSPVDWSYLNGEHATSMVEDGPLPASYDLRTGGRVTAVRNQGTSGACWAFATYGSLESNMMPSETLDFSENNLKNTSGFDSGPNSGGNGDMSTAYLTRWSGPVAETDDPYNPSSTTSPAGLSPVRHVQNVMMLPQRPGPLDTADIKQAIVDYGALDASMCWAGNQWANTSYYKMSTGAYCYDASTAGNHGVTVVGWDDTFPASNFTTPPAGSGAWIVKNSWGTAWGKDGYFFISYYDSVLFKEEPAYCFQVAEPVANYTRAYQYDPLGHTSSFGYGGTDTAWEANVFTAVAAENVRAIGFYTLDVDCSYQVWVYGSWNGSAFGSILSSKTGTIPSPGYHTIVLPSSGAPVTAGQTFGVVVKLVKAGCIHPIALEQPVYGSTGATASTGQSYVSHNGTSWTDVTNWYANTNVCVKAYAGTPSTGRTLTCQTSPASGGSISASPPSAGNIYTVGTLVTLTASPSPGYRFVSWTGATPVSGHPEQATVIMDTDRTVTATFTINTLSDLVGIFRPSTNAFYLRASTGTVPAPLYLGDAGDKPIIGDWNGDGTDEIGIYRPSNAAFYLRSSTGTVPAPIYLGDASDLPIIGDWNGDGTDEIGIFRPSTNAFYLRSSTGAIPAPIFLGDTGDTPIIGDWNGDGTDDIGIFRLSNNGFYLRTGTTVAAPLYLGDTGDLPIIGDWNGDGIDEIGIFRLSNNGFYLRTGTTVAAPIYLGDSLDKPLTGIWPQP